MRRITGGITISLPRNIRGRNPFVVGVLDSWLGRNDRAVNLYTCCRRGMR